MTGFAKVPDSVMRKMHGAGGSAWAMLVAIARQSHFAEGWSCKQLDEHAGCASRTGRHARTELESRGVIERDGRRWKLTGTILPVTAQNRHDLAGAGDGKPAQSCRSNRHDLAGTLYIEKIERLASSAREAGEPPPHRLRDIKARNAKHQASVATAMQTLRQHCKDVGCGIGGLDKVRSMLADAAVAGLDAVAVAQRLIEESAAWAGCGNAGLYWSKPERLPAIIAEMQAAPVALLTNTHNKQATRDAKHIRHALSAVPSDAPAEDAYRMVHAEAREQLQRHKLTTLADVHAWLDSQQEAHHAA